MSAKELQERKAIDDLLMLASEHRMRDTTKLLELAREALCRAEAIGYDLGVAHSLSITSWGDVMQGNYDKAIHDATLALHQLEKILQRLHKRSASLDVVQKCKADALHNIGTAHWGRGSFQEGIPFFEEAIKIHHSAKRYSAEAASLNNLALLYFNLRDYKKSLELHQEALALRRTYGTELEVTSSLSNIGTIYDRLGNFTAALENYQRALTACEKSNYPHLICTSLMNIGTLHAEMHDYDDAIRYYQRALSVARQSQDKHSEGNILGNIALSLIYSQRATEAMPFIEESHALAKQIGDKSGQVHALYNRIQALSALNNPKDALGYIDEALKLLEQTGDKYYKTVMLYKCGELLLELNAPTEEVKRTLDEALDLATTHRFPDSIYKIHLALAQLAERDGKWSDAILHLKEGHRLERELFNEKKTNQIRNLQIAFEVEKAQREAELARLKAEQLQSEVDRKTKELTTLSLYLTQKNELLSELKSRLLQTQEAFRKDKNERLNDLISMLESGAKSENDWKQFERQFAEINPEFLSKLSSAYPSLTPQELKTCMLLKLGFSSKQISAFFYCTIRNAETLRYRVRKKLGLNAEMNLSTFLAQF
ncbi:MAG: tetratricopeptide repeat protein [Chloroherpetonaceae bacterium]